MNSEANPSELGLRRSLGYRFMLAVAAVPTLFFAAAGLNGFNEFVGPVKGAAAPLLKVCVGEFFVALLLVSALSLLWAVAAPAWVERLLIRHAAILQIAVYLFIPGLFAFFWVLGL
jgi:hypothetical protein